MGLSKVLTTSDRTQNIKEKKNKGERKKVTFIAEQKAQPDHDL
jgi:hypothetical protein